MQFNNLSNEEGAVILLNKPYGWTSFDAVKKVRNTLKIKKVGHAGTLDPLATGLLVLCTQKKTKTINEIQSWEKEYTGSMIIGKTTPSFDLETEVDQEKDISHITEEEIRSHTDKFQGVIEQIPPKFSAVKVNGKRAYDLARKGEEFKIEAKKVEIKSFEITDISLPEITFKVVCSKGFYVRSLVRDFGEALGVGAYMSALCRSRIGEFQLEEAWELEDFIQEANALSN
ncbi:tRNA pseudouridine(55) synthase TruB [Rapidithrix thailandica]|uniref:tRNA pseudouridine synthase B n=1 Tax=Rapidithrix thailandica TaxID=413964 RepID=A0AAW9SEG3_9BACT